MVPATMIWHVAAKLNCCRAVRPSKTVFEMSTTGILD
jgi:hypothetical protein